LHQRAELIARCITCRKDGRPYRRLFSAKRWKKKIIPDDCGFLHLNRRLPSSGRERVNGRNPENPVDKE